MNAKVASTTITPALPIETLTNNKTKDLATVRRAVASITVAVGVIDAD